MSDVTDGGTSNPQTPNDQTPNNQNNNNDFDAWLNEKPVSKFVNLPRNGSTITVQFFNGREPRLVEREFDDPEAPNGIKKVKKAQYDVLVPGLEEEGQKWLEAPKTLAEQIRDNMGAGHYLQKIKGTGTGRSVRYSVIGL
jgi:hypothetical protein